MGVDVEGMCESVHISIPVYFLYKQETMHALLKPRFVHTHCFGSADVLNTVFKNVPASEILDSF